MPPSVVVGLAAAQVAERRRERHALKVEGGTGLARHDVLSLARAAAGLAGQCGAAGTREANASAPFPGVPPWVGAARGARLRESAVEAVRRPLGRLEE